jgi:hypothetical protein
MAIALMAAALPAVTACAQHPGPATEDRPIIVLVHSPLVGPSSWAPVAAALRRRGYSVLVPDLRPGTEQGPRYFERHAAIVAEAVKALGPRRLVIVVAHSGAGVLLPPIEAALGKPAVARIFVDAIFPQDGRSRLDLFATPGEAEDFRRAAKDGSLPVWTDADLQGAVPDAGLRRALVAELRPLPLAVYEEPIPVASTWNPVPCWYLRLSDSYKADMERARQAGCRTEERPSSHFAVLTEPEPIADLLAGWIDDATRASGFRDSGRDVVGALAGPELDDANLGQPQAAERILRHDGLDPLARVGHGHDDSARPRDLPAGNQEVSRSIVFVEKRNVGAHLRVDLRERRLVGELDDEHRGSLTDQETKVTLLGVDTR